MKASGLNALGRRRQTEVYRAGIAGRRQRVPFTFPELEEWARRKLSPEAYAYIAGGAGAEQTMRSIEKAFEHWAIVPRMLRDVSTRDSSVELFGRRLPGPFLIAPIGVLEMAHRDADLAVARAAASVGVPMIFSSQASQPMEDCAAVMGDAPRWFQLYWGTSNDVVASFVERAERCGCEAIVITLDIPIFGWRTRDLDRAYVPFLRGKGIAQYTSDSSFRGSLAGAHAGERGPINLAVLRALIEITRSYPGRFLPNLRSPLPRAAVRTFVETYANPSLIWDDLSFLRERTTLPILLKGILHPDDARRAVECGMDGIVVSNHGGRQLDGEIASLDALPPIVEAVQGRIEILLDSGIRTGADTFKALALGAAAVLIGRPYAYGLALAGEDGVREVIENFLADFDITLGLAGFTSVAEITADALVRT